MYAAVGSTGNDIVTAAATGLEMSADASTGQLHNCGNNKYIISCLHTHAHTSHIHTLNTHMYYIQLFT